MKYILLEDLNLLIIQNGEDWDVKSVDIELIEMDCIKVDDKYYERVEFIDTDILEIQPIPSTNREFDDFDLQISCEEYYGG